MRPAAPPQTPFDRFHGLGYSVVPVIPPGAEISPYSSLHKRVGTHQDARGKLPGTKGKHGWASWDWISHVTDPEDFPRWHAMGAGVGIRTGSGLLAIDADTQDEELAKIIRDKVLEHFGATPIRVGRYPKALYLIRTTDPYPYRRVEFGAERVEILSDRKFFVAEGIHNRTLKPYTWPKPITHYDDLSLFTPEQIDAFMADLKASLPEAELKTEGAGDTPISQESLRGDPATVAKAVRATPNTSALFPTREAYRDFGYAIKAALPDNEPMAKDLFHEWCARWDGGDNDPDVIDADWRRMKPPFRRGASWLYDLAEKHGNGAFNLAEVHFDPVPEHEPSPFEVQAQKEREETDDTIQINASAYTFPNPADIPRREWVYGTHLIRKFVSATVAPSGVGKSSLIIAEAVAMASGKPLLGVEPKGQFRVWLWNGEDPIDELQRRVAAVMLHYGIQREDIEDRLFLDSGRNLEIVLAHETRDGATIAQPVVRALTQTLMKNRIDVMQVDPFVSSHRVSENDNGAIDLVSKQWAKIANDTGCAIDLVHHVRKLNGAEITVEDSRGAVSLIATSRSARALTKMQKNEAAKLGIETRWQRFFRFGDGKANLAPPAGDAGREGWMELISVGLGNGGGSGLDAVIEGDSVGVVVTRTAAEMEKEGTSGLATLLGEPAVSGAEGVQDQVVRAIREAGVPLRKDMRAGDAWVGVQIARVLKLDPSDKTDRGKINALISAWIKANVLVEVTRPDAKRMPRTYVEAPYKDEGVFD